MIFLDENIPTNIFPVNDEKKSWLILYSDLLYKMGQDFFDI